MRNSGNYNYDLSEKLHQNLSDCIQFLFKKIKINKTRDISCEKNEKFREL